MRAYELEESAVEELKDRLPKLKVHDYNTIDRLMNHVSSKHKITGKKLHDMFVRKYGHTPDTWIKKYKNKLGEEGVVEGSGYTVDDEIQHWKDMALHWARMGDEKSMLKCKANLKAAEQKKKQGVAEGQLDELSPKTLGSYVNKASKDVGTLGYGLGDIKARPGKYKDSPDVVKSVQHSFDKRINGVEKASNRLSKQQGVAESDDKYIELSKKIQDLAQAGKEGEANKLRYELNRLLMLDRDKKRRKERGVAEGEVLPLKRPMSKVQHGKRTFPPTQRDVKEPEGNVTPLNQKKSNVSEGVEGPDDVQKIKDFIKWSYKTLNMQKPYPKITISKNTEVAQKGHHTGVHKGDKIWVYVGNRNMIDIFRTIFHELTHHRQMQLNMIKDGDSYPGSPIEMLADMAAGKYIKIYGKNHPEMFQ